MYSRMLVVVEASRMPFERETLLAIIGQYAG
jgi:hypothetical protein